MKTSITIQKIAMIAVGCLFGSFCATAQIIYNGSFETGVDPGWDFRTVSTGDSTTIAGWTVSSGNVDYIGGRWVAADGARSVDLNWGAPGAISQTVSGFSVGQEYRLHFSLTASPDAPLGATRTMRIEVATISRDFSEVSTHSTSNPGWDDYMMDFTAAAADLTLTFSSLDLGAWGPALDNVSLQIIPEPGALSLALLGIGLAGFISRRSHRS